MGKPRTERVRGVLVVDKPRGPTSHDVVARARRALGTRSIGHAGTLDPAASGVLVLAVGEGTKLVPVLSADDKEYEATVRLGVQTDTLDGEGEVTERAELPNDLSPGRVREVAGSFVGTLEQRAPAHSALKVRGQALHARVRRGESVEPPVRSVQLREVEVLWVEPPRIGLRLTTGKGFYVRSFARDLARALGTVGHLEALRRTRSGAFGLEQGLDWAVLERAAGAPRRADPARHGDDGGDPEAARRVRAALQSLEQACSALPRVQLSERGRRDALHGRPIGPEGCAGGALPEPLPQGTVALIDPEGRLVALGRAENGRLRVVRGFN